MKRFEETAEETARRYDACHPDDSFADLVRRSSFSKEDRRLMEDWLAATAASVQEPGLQEPSRRPQRIGA